LTGLVVAAEDGDAVSETDFEGDEEGDCFDAVVASVYVVAHEQVVCVGGVSAYAEEFLEVVELAVDVAADCDGTPYGLDV
jgi:hypothetical protein